MSLVSTLPNMANLSALVVGDIMLDRYWFGDTARISPEAPVPIVKIASMDHRPGGAGNVALNLAALGINVTLLGFTGQDEAADILSTQLKAAQVNFDACKLPNISTIIKLRVISRRQQLLRLDFESTLQIENDLLLERYKKHLKTAQIVILSDYNKGTLTQVGTLIKLAKEANIPVIVDPKSQNFNIYQHAAVITPNFKEFEAVVGSVSSEKVLIEKAERLIAETHIDALLITRGEQGMTLIEKGQHAHFPAYAREVLDVTGAGDTVISTFSAMYAAGLSLKKAAGLSNLAASLVVAKLGATSISVPELTAALTKQNRFFAGIVNEEQLLQSVNEAKAAGKKIVFTNGCFDIIHAGHVSYLQVAKELGDYLIVAVNTDESIKQNKGPHRPINNLEHRMTVLAGLSVVDWVVPFADKTPERLLHLLKPDVLVKGGDYTLDQIVGADIVHSYGGEVRIADHPLKSSSTAIWEKLQQTNKAAGTFDE